MTTPWPPDGYPVVAGGQVAGLAEIDLRGGLGERNTATVCAPSSMTISAPSRTRVSKAAKSRAASAAEMWIVATV